MTFRSYGSVFRYSLSFGGEAALRARTLFLVLIHRGTTGYTHDFSYSSANHVVLDSPCGTMTYGGGVVSWGIKVERKLPVVIRRLSRLTTHSRGASYSNRAT